MYHLLISLLLILSINQAVECSYRYAGCFPDVFHNTHFSSSFMEPTLCFRLCDTPIIYLQKTICRCSGGGLMHQNRQDEKVCSLPCPLPVDRNVKTTHTCGGVSAYSAYVLDKFYSKHGHLFQYQIRFLACELWKISTVYDASPVTFTHIIVRSSLNRLEACAAACLDQNATTKSIAFNDDGDKCLCIQPLKPAKNFDRMLYISVLNNTSCDRYCNNTAEGSAKVGKYQCGSLSDARIWAIYDLNGSCPMNFVYISDLKKCVYTYKNFWNSCTPPSTSFIYDGSLSWTSFLNMMARLHLNDSIVTVEFDKSVVIDPSWKCSTMGGNASTSSSSSLAWQSYLSHTRSTLYGWSSTTRYILDNRCLVESSYSSYSHRYSYRLCVTTPINKYSGSDEDDSNETYIASVNPTRKFCPTNWFDLNGRCYRISDEKKTIAEARNSCINASPSSSIQANAVDKPRIWLIDSYGNLVDNDELNDSPKGTIVEYVSVWQARLGFFFLDTDPDGDSNGTVSATSTVHNLSYDESLVSSDDNESVSTDHDAINEFHVIGFDESKNGSMSNDSCMLITRAVSEEEERPILRSEPIDTCPKPRHVLCETNTLIVPNFQYGCFDRPSTLDLPALITNQLTHELCLAVCQELQTKLAVLNINKCYCFNGVSPHALNITIDFENSQKKTCGIPCAGNTHESCGDENTIVVFQILDSRRTFTINRTPPEPFPNYIYLGCARFSAFNQSTMYRFTIDNLLDRHPRYCLALCTKYKQKYALLNNVECICTNKKMEDGEGGLEILRGQNCPLQCPGNYFYTCGNPTDSTIYSNYTLQPKCRHGFEVAENDEQCVYSHFSTKTDSLDSARTYCRSVGSTLAKIKEIVEIQDVLPESILHTRLMQQLLITYKFKFVNDTRHYWIDRTDDVPDPTTLSSRLLKQCSETSQSANKNCIAIQYVPSADPTKTSHERCIVESNACTTQSAMPVCVDQHLEPKVTLVPPISADNPAAVSANMTIDHSCDDPNGEYDFVDDYCYKILPHEVSWNDAKSLCQKDNAMVFVPEKSVALQYIKSLYVRQRTYTSSGFAHVGVYYDHINRTVVQYTTAVQDSPWNVPDSNAIYDLCEKTFQEQNEALTLSSSLTTAEKNLLKKQQIGCAYIDLTSNAVPTIRCDEIPCNRTATVICQKLPSTRTRIVTATRRYTASPSTTSVTKPFSSSTKATAGTFDDGPSDSSSTVAPFDDSLDIESSTLSKSIGRDFAPLFFILTIFFALILLGFIGTFYKRLGSIFHRSSRHTTNSVYSELTSADEFDLNWK